MPASDFELRILDQLAQLQSSSTTVQVGVGALHSRMDNFERLINGAGSQKPLADRLAMLETALDILIGNRDRPPLSERVSEAERAISEMRKKHEDRDAEAKWFKRLVLSNLVQWLITGGGVLWILTHLPRSGPAGG